MLGLVLWLVLAAAALGGGYLLMAEEEAEKASDRAKITAARALTGKSQERS